MSFLLVGTSQSVYYQSRVHQHRKFELILNLEGSGVMTVGNKTTPFFPGSVHFVPAGTLHGKSSKDGFRDIYLQTDTWDTVSHGSLVRSPLTFSDSEEKIIESLMNMMLLRYLRQKKPDSLLYAMCDLVMQLSKERCDAQKLDPVVEKIIQRLTLSFNDPELLVADVLEESGYAKDYIRRRFIAETGVTPAAYLTSIRISNAKKLLRLQDQMEITVGEIAAMCGYYDAGYFSRVFKKETGQSPAEYAEGKRALS